MHRERLHFSTERSEHANVQNTCIGDQSYWEMLPKPRSCCILLRAFGKGKIITQPALSHDCRQPKSSPAFWEPPLHPVTTEVRPSWSAKTLLPSSLSSSAAPPFSAHSCYLPLVCNLHLLLHSACPAPWLSMHSKILSPRLSPCS